ncbi:methyltransferase family [Ceratocystis lukuohia]|uniref:carnosine N-methyltransferase n=1 Tax=Ceratocystis lukuohia TaxID=2019550 RepID=A0ABR4MIV4_9PEZI
MAKPHTEDWHGLEGSAIKDEEEARVLFSALDSFVRYARTAHFSVTHLRRQSFYALPEAHWKMLAAPPFNFLDTLMRTDDAIDSNAELARTIARFGLKNFVHLDVPEGPDADVSIPPRWAGVASHSDIDKARSTIRQFYRDWSEAGKVERDASYGPVIRALEKERALHTGQGPLDILVPGAGLGRLVYELCCHGHNAEGNEISYHQLVASSYILNCAKTANQHTIFPWVHTFSNHPTRDSHLRSYTVPDVHPAAHMRSLKEQGKLVGEMSMCAADFICLYGDDEHKESYDAVATVFFLDTAPNLIRYLEVIWSCLKPGGILVNMGPLLWHFENNAPGNHGKDTDGDGLHESGTSSGIADPGSFELSDDEVMALLTKIGFRVESRETGLAAPYITNPESMLQTVYKASTWVARKPKS